MGKRLVWAALVLAAGAARAQQDGQQGGAPPAARSAPASRAAAPAPSAGTSDAFDRACIDLLQGRTPQGDQAIKALREACGNLMSARTDDRIRQEQRLRAERQARADQAAAQRSAGQQNVQPGVSTAQPQQGQGVLSAFDEAGRELVNPGSRTRELGMRPRGPVGWSLVTNPVGYFTGIGVNATLFHALEDAPKISWVAGARYSVADATNGTAQTFGILGGADLFIIGRNNEGVRIGPRVELAAGRETFLSNSTTFARMGLGGEVGYNFVAANGITGGLGLGLGGRVAGDSKNSSFASFVGGEFGPYLNVALGYSW
jgi:hypothetical protein